MIKVLIVDDSETSRLALRYIINRAEDMEIVAEAKSGEEGIRLTEKLRPDIILMDMVMPGMDGLEATSEIMHQVPTPIIVISASLEGSETEIAFRAMRRGALTVLQKPVGPLEPQYPAQADRILQTLRTMSGVRVIHHKRVFSPPTKTASKPVIPKPVLGRADVVAIVSSTGGPGALSEILGKIPVNYPLPIIVVQHITADFLPSMVKWLNTVASLNVQIAVEGDSPSVGNVYFAPGHAHLCLDSAGRFCFNTKTKASITPSGDVLLESIAKYYQARAVGVILTGMGDDGTVGLGKMYQAGAFTIAQDEASSVVFGMPQAAIKKGVVRSVLSLSEIPNALLNIP